MRLFKSRKSGEYSDVSSVVANENDPHVKIVSCNAQQEFHNNDQNDSGDKQPTESDNPSSNCGYALDEHKQHPQIINQTTHSNHHNNISYNLIPNDTSCTDKFTPIPECDKIDETITTHYECTASTYDTQHNQQQNSTATAKHQETHQHSTSSDSTSDFINELFGISIILLCFFSFHFPCHACVFFSAYKTSLLFWIVNYLKIIFISFSSHFYSHT